MSNLGLSGKIIRVMLACPSDIRDEIDIFFREVQDWNIHNAEEYKVALLPKHWTTHSHPQLGTRAQGVINEQLVDKADFLIAVIGNKLGTATGVAESGTVEEMLQFYNTGRPVKLYFSEIANLTAAALLDENVRREAERVAAFRDKAKELGLYSSYSSLPEFAKQISLHIMQEIRSLRDKGFISAIVPQAEQATISSPQSSFENSTLKNMRRSVERLQIEWRGEAGSHLSRYSIGKQIMSKLLSVLSSHIPELRELYSNDQLAPLEEIIPTAIEVQQATPVMGLEFHKEFWDTGTQVFTDLLSRIETLSHVQRG